MPHRRDNQSPVQRESTGFKKLVAIVEDSVLHERCLYVSILLASQSKSQKRLARSAESSGLSGAARVGRTEVRLVSLALSAHWQRLTSCSRRQRENTVISCPFLSLPPLLRLVLRLRRGGGGLSLNLPCHLSLPLTVNSRNLNERILGERALWCAGAAWKVGARLRVLCTQSESMNARSSLNQFCELYRRFSSSLARCEAVKRFASETRLDGPGEPNSSSCSRFVVQVLCKDVGSLLFNA